MENSPNSNITICRPWQADYSLAGCLPAAECSLGEAFAAECGLVGAIVGGCSLVGAFAAGCSLVGAVVVEYSLAFEPLAAVA